MIENESHVAVKMGSERGFGLVFAAIFLIVGLLPLFGSGQIRIWALLAAGMLALIAWLKPRFLARPNRLWFRLGLALGHVVGVVVMSLVYIIVVVPTGLLMRLLGKDPLRSRASSDEPTYWIERTTEPGSMKDQF